jgi:hypothetical protein
VPGKKHRLVAHFCHDFSSLPTVRTSFNPQNARPRRMSVF